MKKPKDYSKYFHENGKSKECPYEFVSEEHDKWVSRARTIYRLMLPEKLRRDFEEYQRNKYSASCNAQHAS